MLKKEEKLLAEYKYGVLRLQELQLNPIQGNFDLEHIRAINYYIFQDLPKLGEEYAFIYKPGQFRDEVVANMIWNKHRKMPGIENESIIVYSNMNRNIIDETELFLRTEIDIKKMQRMSRLEFVKKIGEIYTRLDYVHLFSDGNSRTLREFTREIGLKAGFDLNWEMFNENQKKRNELYIARDLSVNQIAIERATLPELKYDIQMYMKPFDKFKKLPELLKKSVLKKSHEIER